MEVEGTRWGDFLSLGTKVKEKQGKGCRGCLFDGGNTLIEEWDKVVRWKGSNM